MSFQTSSYTAYPSSAETDFLMPGRGKGHIQLPDVSIYRGEKVPLCHLSDNSGTTSFSSHQTRRLDDSNQIENEALLQNKPVILAQSWESTHAPGDELSLNVKILNAANEINNIPPEDRLNLVFLILMLHGVGTLISWNMFITAKPYFEYKLNVNATDGSTEEYKSHFISYLGVACQVPNVICNALNIFVDFGGGSITLRIVGSIAVEIVIFILTIVLAMLDSSTWAGAFFYITMASVVVLNMVNGIYQNSLYGLAAKLPMKYSQAIILGANTSGTFSSILSILSIAASPNQKTAALYYFITALFVLLACIDSYFALPLIRYYRYHERKVKKVQSESYKGSKPPYWKIFKQTSMQCFNVFFIFFVTLTIFPAIHSDIKPVDPNFILAGEYFTPVTCFLVFNVFAMFGSLLPSWITWPSHRYLWIPVVLRVFMIPYFMLCNYVPDRRQIPVLITNDWAYVGMGVALGLTSGYFSSLAMMYAPRCVDTEHASIAGMMAALFLVLGIVCGVNFTFFISWLVETKLF